MPLQLDQTRYFIGGGVDDDCTVVEACKPHAEIGVFSDVVGVPAADFALLGGAD